MLTEWKARTKGPASDIGTAGYLLKRKSSFSLDDRSPLLPDKLVLKTCLNLSFFYLNVKEQRDDTGCSFIKDRRTPINKLW